MQMEQIQSKIIGATLPQITCLGVGKSTFSYGKMNEVTEMASKEVHRTMGDKQAIW